MPTIALSLSEALPYLAEPETHTALIQKDAAKLAGSTAEFLIHEGLPLLLPKRLYPYIGKDRLHIPDDKKTDKSLQYFYISLVKLYSSIQNSAMDDIWYRKHQGWSREFLEDTSGLHIDIGCDNVEESLSLFPDNVRYIGLDPHYSIRPNPFRIIGFGEFMPFQSDCADSVSFLTSLDHIFDWHSAIEEAYRVLRPDGKLYLSSLIWWSRAGLSYDDVHFHHFREAELHAKLSAHFTITDTTYQNWKDDTHRRVMFVKAHKPAT